MDLRLKLKKPYTWGNNNEKSNNIGFVQTKSVFQMGDIFTFQSLNAKSMGGDLSTNHYKYFENKRYKIVGRIDTRVRFGWEAEEI